LEAIKSIFFVLAYFFLSQLSAQSIKGNGFPDGNIAKVYYYNGLEHSLLQSYTVANGQFQIKYDLGVKAIGYIVMKGFSPAMLVLNAEDIELKPLFPAKELRVISGSENKFLDAFLRAKDYREKSLSAWVYLDSLSRSEVYRGHSIAKRTIHRQLSRIETKIHKSITGLNDKTFVGWFLRIRHQISSIVFSGDISIKERLDQLEFLRNLDYSDERLWHTGLIRDALEYQLAIIPELFTAQDSIVAQYKKTVHTILGKVITDEEKYEKLFAFFFDFMERNNLTYISEYLALQESTNGSCLKDVALSHKLDSYRKLKVGSKAPNIDFSKGELFNNNSKTCLDSIKSPYILLMFAADWCPNCQEKIPQLKSLVPVWSELGIEIIQISLNETPDSSGQAFNQYPWMTYCDFMKWESPVVQSYYVIGTPTYFLLDRNKNILLKSASFTQLSEFIQTHL
jgi:thiol-disulfide isomerase/thioredoxin